MGKKNKKFALDAYKKKQKFLANNNYLKVETSLYSIISGVIQKEVSAYVKYDFIRTVLKRLITNLPVEQRTLIRKNVYDMLTAFDKDYRNYFGELAVVNQLLEDEYTLVGVEKDKICGGKTADFTIKKNGQTRLVVVVNIHFYEPTGDSVQFINKKVSDKLNEKTNGSEEYEEFTLVPVLWAFPKELFEYHQQYNAGNVQMPENVHEPFAYLSFSDDKEILIHKFTKISRLFTADSIEIIKP